MKLSIEENHFFDSYDVGLIAREEHLTLTESSHAVIQPSKFEGWSNIIEDPKTAKDFVIAWYLDV